MTTASNVASELGLPEENQNHLNADSPVNNTSTVQVQVQVQVQVTEENVSGELLKLQDDGNVTSCSTSINMIANDADEEAGKLWTDMHEPATAESPRLTNESVSPDSESQSGSSEIFNPFTSSPNKLGKKLLTFNTTAPDNNGSASELLLQTNADESVNTSTTGNPTPVPNIPITPLPPLPHLDIPLPSKQDRLLLYRYLEESSVNARIRAIQSLPDTRPRDWRGRIVDSYPHPSLVGIRARQISYLRLELLPIISASLLLHTADLEQYHDNNDYDDDVDNVSNDDDVDKTQEGGRKLLQEPMNCMTLLISNIILLSKGSYDARIRSIVKACCVQIFMRIYKDAEEIQTETNEEAEKVSPAETQAEDAPTATKATPTTTTTNSAISSKQSSPRALYYLTDDLKKDAKQDAKSKESKNNNSNNAADSDNDDDSVASMVKNSSDILQPTQIQIAKERFETLEKAIATDILKVMIENESKKQQEAEISAEQAAELKKTRRRQGIKKILIRGLQIGTVSLVVGGLFAVTGGLAAPGLVAALTAFGVGSAIPAFATLTTTTALASMFGVVGAGLAGYKMKKRTDGVSEWRIRKEFDATGGKDDQVIIRGLHATVCVSGWLESKEDFQTPFGVQANDPPSKDLLEKLQRFFCVHGPEKVPFCKALIRGHKKKENELWQRLESKYGVDPDHLLPFDKSNEPKLFDESTERTIDGLLKSQVLEERHAKEMEEIYESNNMLAKMELMNAEMFANLNMETLSAMKGLDESDDDDEGIYVDDTYDDSSEALRLRLQQAQEIQNVADSEDKNASDSQQQLEKGENKATEDTDQFDHDKTDDRRVPSLTNHEEEGPIVNDHPSTSNPDFPESQSTCRVAVAENMGDSVVTESNQEDTMSTVSTNQSLLSNNPNKNSDRHDDNQAASELASPDYNEDEIDDDQAALEDSSPAEHADSVSGGTNQEAEMEEKESKSLDDSDHSDLSGSQGKGVSKTTDHTLLVWDWEAIYGGELYTVTWESDFILKLCKVVDVLALEIGSQVSREVLKQTLIGGMVAAVAIPSALTTATGVIDDPYQLISFRSEIAGVELAQCLLSSDETRPVSLVGFSFGARVIFSCLLELARHQTLWEEQRKPKPVPEGDGSSKKRRSWMNRATKMSEQRECDKFEYKREPASIVEDVVLIGMPRLIDPKEWISARELVAGRLVNCYNKNDWILSYMINIRCWNGVSRTCGTHEIRDVFGVENYEVSHLASSHGRYRLSVPHILHFVGYGEPFPKKHADSSE